MTAIARSAILGKGMRAMLDKLPPEQKVAIAYAPPADAGMVMAMLALDNHFGSILKSTTEVILGQMKLAWWRDQLKAENPRNPGGNELLALVYENWGDDAAALSVLADGWEALLTAETLDGKVLDSFSSGRARAWLAYAHRAGVQDADANVLCAAKRWALADLLQGLSDDVERALVLADLENGMDTDIDLPRALRPLSILSGLARRASKNGGQPLMQDRMAALVALRLGIFGR